MLGWQLVAITVLVVAWFVIQRYFDHEETRYLLERTEQWQRYLELRERWKIRRGMLTGVFVLLLGLALFYWYAGSGFTMLNSGQIGYLETIGWFLIVVGVVIIASHAKWSRQPLPPAFGPPSPSVNDAEENR